MPVHILQQRTCQYSLHSRRHWIICSLLKVKLDTDFVSFRIRFKIYDDSGKQMNNYKPSKTSKWHCSDHVFSLSLNYNLMYFIYTKT